MSASFNGITFSERGESGTYFPAPDAQSDETEHLIPGGTRVVTQTSGHVVKTLNLVIHCNKATLTNLYGAVGTEGTLIYSFGSTQARLNGISSPKEIRTHGRYEATLNLRIYG